jgi:hypothetical protein
MDIITYSKKLKLRGVQSLADVYRAVQKSRRLVRANASRAMNATPF